MLTREARTGAEWQVLPDSGRAPTVAPRVTLAAGPSRRVRIAYRAHVGDAKPVTVGKLRLDVRAGVTLKVRPKRVRGGRSIRLAGRLKAAPRTRLGKVITLQARERGRWRDFKSARTQKGGRFSARYRFSAGASGTFPIRAVARADASYPYATGRSKAVRVRAR